MGRVAVRNQVKQTTKKSMDKNILGRGYDKLPDEKESNVILDFDIPTLLLSGGY